MIDDVGRFVVFVAVVVVVIVVEVVFVVHVKGALVFVRSCWFYSRLSVLFGAVVSVEFSFAIVNVRGC